MDYTLSVDTGFWFGCFEYPEGPTGGMGGAGGGEWTKEGVVQVAPSAEEEGIYPNSFAAQSECEAACARANGGWLYIDGKTGQPKLCNEDSSCGPWEFRSWINRWPW